MTAPTPTPPDKKTDDAKAMTAAEAAKRVKRVVVSRVPGKDADGNPTEETETSAEPVKASEVLSFRDYGTHVVVVTKDGQKFSSLDA